MGLRLGEIGGKPRSCCDDMLRFEDNMMRVDYIVIDATLRLDVITV
jgi:hypothetical protein